jgi:hypothetical protein
MKNCKNCTQTIENCECHISRDKEKIDFIEMIGENVSYKEEEFLSIIYDKIKDAKKESRRNGFSIGILTVLLFQIGSLLMGSLSIIYMIFGIIFSAISIFIALPYVANQLITIYLDVKYYFIKNKKDDKN